MRACQVVAALALQLGPTTVSPFTFSTGVVRSHRVPPGSRQSQLTRRFVLDSLNNLGKIASGDMSGEDLSLGPENKALLAKFEKRVERINSLEPDIEKLSDQELRAKTKEFREHLAKGTDLDDLLEEAFAVVREAAWRVLELRHYDVQLMGGMVLNAGRLAEMATGEGKTLAATLPTYLNALEGRGALVVTANEYLAKRDAETVGQIYRFLGLSVGLIQASLPEAADRKEAYGCDVTYVTNSELGFDYLRDNLALEPEARVTNANRPGGQEGGPAYCLVDEADSILIDEARTPLIISKKVDAPSAKYELSAQLVQVLKEGKEGTEDEGDYTVSLKEQQVTMTDKGFRKCEEILQKPLFDSKDPWAPFVLNALKAKALFEKDVQYIVRDKAKTSSAEAEATPTPPGDDPNGGAPKGGKEVCIVDTFSGRVMDGRRWSDGLHQSIEAKEGLDVSTESMVIATVTYQALFRMFPKLCGMSGTALSDSMELNKVYGLKVTPVPTALPVARRDYDDVVYKSAAAKTRAVIAEVARVAGTGRPVLVGTTSVQDSEELASKLRARMGDQAHRLQVLNAKPENVGSEGVVVSQAGRLGAVTVATNMAGRGTDILLGGNPTLLASLSVRDGLVAAGALTLASQADRADGEDKGGEPSGASAAAAQLQFEPMPEGFFPCALSAEAQALVLAAAAKLLEDEEPFESLLELEELVAIASERAPIRDQGVLALRKAFEAAKKEFAEALGPEKEQVRKLGGLYVVGTERHESRRIDSQLRGRAGRQGDPGASRFFLSLEDKMLRTFGADRLGKMMETFRVSEDTPLEAKRVSEAIDKVQTRVEEYYSGIRSQVFTFDEVLATQRFSYYKRRAEILEADDASLEVTLRAYCEATVDDIVPNYIQAPNAAGEAAADEVGGAGGGGGMAGVSLGGKGSLVVDGAGLADKVAQFFPGTAPLDPGELSALGGGKAVPLVAELVKAQVAVGLAAKKAEVDALRPRQFARVAQYLALVQLDNNWADHLGRMNLLKESVVMRKYMGRDVLEEYVTEGAELFKDLLASARRSTVYSLFTYAPVKNPKA